MTFLRKGAQIAILTFISRIFGLIRELLIAQIFGVSAVSDSLNIAFKLPNLFRRIFAEGALSSVFVPIFNSKFIDSKESARIFTGEVFSLLLITLIILVGIIQIFMPYLMIVIAPGFYLDIEKFELTVLLCRITMPYLIFISVTAFFGSVLNSFARFAAFAASPIIFNIGIIFATLMNLQDLSYFAVIISLFLLISGAMQVIFMFICLKCAEFTFPIILNPRDKDVQKFLRNMAPATISAGAMQLNLFISQTIASFLPGVVSIITYADRIYQFPLSIIGISFSTILLPELSKMYKLFDLNLAHKLQNKAIRLAILISLPASIGIFILSKPIVHIIYEHGAFNTVDTIKTAQVISAFTLGLPAFILIKILTPIFYANLDQRTPLKITIYSMIVNTMLNICLMPYLLHIGIALGSSIAAWINAVLLYVYARKKINLSLDHELLIFCIKVIICSIIMIITLVIFNYQYEAFYYHASLMVKIFVLTTSITISILAFGASCLIFSLHKQLAKNI